MRAIDIFSEQVQSCKFFGLTGRCQAHVAWSRHNSLLHIVNHSENSMLKGKTALVTGSTSGIGLGIAKALAKQGANIVLNGFGDHAGPEADIAALGAKVAYHCADMSKPAEIEAMVKFA